MKKYIIIAFLGFFGEILAQTVKYKDLFLMIQQNKKDQAFPLIKQIARKDTQYASVNMQLGLLFYEKSLAFDELKESDAIIKNADSSIFYMNRAFRQMNEKEIRKNDEYYLEYYNKPNITQNRDSVLKRVKNDIEYKTTKITTHKNSVSKIYKSFSKGSDFYFQSASIYKKLNEKFQNENELCLLVEDAEKQQLHNLVLAFDSVLFYENDYKSQIKNYPLKSYNQDFIVRNIETFRIDGFSKPNFLDSKVFLWNYTEWANKLIKILETDIKELKSKSDYTYQKYSSYHEKIQNNQISEDTITNLKADIRLHRLLSKYAPYGMIQKLLDYKLKKIFFSSSEISKLNNLSNTTTENFDQKATLMYGQTKKIIICDSAFSKLKNIQKKTELLKNKSFIENHFKNEKGFDNQMIIEQSFLNESKKESKNKYLNLIYNQADFYRKNELDFTYNNIQIPLFITKDEISKYKIINIKEDKFQNKIIAGKNPDNKNFITKLNAQNQIIWFKIIPIKNSSNEFEFISSIDFYQEGVIAALNSKVNGTIKNTIICYDKNGLEISSKVINSSSVIRKIIYDDLTDTYFFVSKGTEIEDIGTNDELVNISSNDLTGQTRWFQSINFKGVVADFEKIYEGFLIGCNYTSIGKEPNLVKSQAGDTPEKTNILLLKFTNKGELLKYETINKNEPIFMYKITKINNNNINIVGYNKEMTADWKTFHSKDFDLKSLQIINSNLDFINF